MTPSRLRWAIWGLVPAAALAAGALYLAFRADGTAPAASATREGPAATWRAGEERAPDFRLSDQYGRPVTLAALRGKRVLVTFVDPNCTTFCPRESIVINDMLRRFAPAERPAVVAVNVDPRVTSTAKLRREARRFGWLPQWRWGAGTAAALERVWRDYHIQVVETKDDIGHTEAVYLVDSRGHQRALYLWPFTADELAATLGQLP